MFDELQSTILSQILCQRRSIVLQNYHAWLTISLDDFKNLWQIFEKLFFSMNNYDVVSSLLDDVNAYDDGNLHIISINYH